MHELYPVMSVSLPQEQAVPVEQIPSMEGPSGLLWRVREPSGADVSACRKGGKRKQKSLDVLDPTVLHTLGVSKGSHSSIYFSRKPHLRSVWDH